MNVQQLSMAAGNHAAKPLSRWFAGMLIAAACMAMVSLPTNIAKAEPQPLEPADSPVDNPLKGLVPYSDPERDRFPHSMEFDYLPLSALMIGENQFDWKPMDNLLDDIASRGNQAVIRVYMEYPNKKEGIPEHLVAAGLKTHQYLNTNTQPLPPSDVITPDYNDPKLRAALKSYIAALGKRYDGDPRLAYITAGLLGTWGEWHTYPRNDLWAGRETQAVVLDAYAAAFTKTPVQLRYPVGTEHWQDEPNDSRPFGYHDDSFAWATLNTGKDEDNWFYMAALQAAGSKALKKWEQHPIGGEIRPELWGKIFDKNVGIKEAQDFDECVTQTHATWLMDTGLFREQASTERRKRAIKSVRRLGYDFRVLDSDVPQQVAKQKLPISLRLTNQGVAPMYHAWAIELAAINADGEIAQTWPAETWTLTGLLPNGTKRTWNKTLDCSELPPGEFAVAVRVVNPLKNGKPLRFANATQDKHRPGWLTIGTFQNALP